MRNSFLLLVITASILLVVFLTGCGSMSEEEKHAYRNAKTIKPIEMPPGLQNPESRESLAIPEQTATEIASVDELEKPPEIVSSVDLKMLDEETGKSAEKSSSDSAPANAASDTVESAAGENQQVAKAASLNIVATKNSDGDSLLLVDANVDDVFPLVRPALLELGFTIDDSSKGGMLYEISKELPTLRYSEEPVHPGDEEPEVKEEYQIHLKPSEGKTEITVHNKFGQIEGSGLADHLLLQIKEIMEKPKKASDSNNS